MHSLLDDALLTVRYPDEEPHAATLPRVLAQLSENNVTSFDALQTHQEQAWYSFLVQLAAVTAAREFAAETAADAPTDPAAWGDALIDLAGGEAAWHLVVDDLSQPAFLQSPVPEGDLDDPGYKADVPTPDRLDVLVTSKNHDVKRTRIARPRPEHWIYALCTLQTMEGFLGRGNYGIVRMNGGFGNRPLVGLAPELTWGKRFRRDLDVLLSERDALGDAYDLTGPALIWTEPWNGQKDDALPLAECDPYFIEICRRIRLIDGDDGITCARANTKGQRIDAPDDLNGVTKDPWTPVEKSDVKALTLGGSGFTYRRLQEIFFGGEYASPPALQFQEGEDGGAYLIAQAMVRGQGKTDGLHHRVVFVPNTVKRRFLQRPETKEKAAERARTRVALADQVQSRVLYPAVAALLGSGDGDEVDYEDAAPWIEAFDEAVDEQFFDALWTSVEEEMSDQEARAHWEAILWREAEQVFDEAECGTPIADNRRWRARSRARSLFYGSAAQVFETAPYAPDTSESDESNRQLA